MSLPAANMSYDSFTCGPSRFHFSFADWYGPGVKQNFGALRVVNDDLVKGNSGFGAHPHSNAEIFSCELVGWGGWGGGWGEG